MKRIVAVILMLLILIISFVSNIQSAGNTITVSGGVTSESQILGSLVSEMIEHYTDNKVEFLNNLGTATIDQQAMQRGDLDISATRYTGTDLVTTLGEKTEKDPTKTLRTVQTQFERRFGYYWSDGYGFSNQFTFLVTKETAKKYHLKTVSDLRRVASRLSLGTDQAWYKRAGDGYLAFSKYYGMKFRDVYPIQVGILYDALVNKELDVILGYSTDGRIGSYDLVMLKDDKKFFPPYAASFVLSKDTLQRYPKLKGILNKLSGTIDTKTMQKLNFQADDEMLEPQKVAKEFLEKHKYFEEGEKK